ncbi:S8 family serine peptidase [Desulfobacterales bacterium HSG2]|nr:S8 family serine peptidase [Desulfobacterales bacterium HSG2]
MADLGISIRVDPDLNPEISASFEDRDTQKGLASIFKSFDHVLIWKTVEAPPPGRIFRLAEIQIFKPGKKENMKPFGRRSALSVARNPKDGSLFVRNEILLRLRPGIRFSEFKKLLKQVGGTVLERNPLVGIYRIRVGENTDIPALAALLTKHPGIAKSEPNYAYPISFPYRSSEPSASGTPPIPLPGGKVPIAVLDTGLAPDSGLDDFILASLDAMNPDEPISDALGHGTQMALIAAGVVRPYGVSSETEAPEARNPIIPIRAFDDNGLTSSFNIMRSIDFALENGARVMSLSWSSETRSDFMEKAFDYADSKGLVMVAAAGNEPTGKQVWPAAYKSVIGVGALAPDGKPWKKSNYGNFVSVSAPGFASLPVGYKGDPGNYAGTSISTAYVANSIANYLSENPKAKKKDVFNALDDLF